MHVQKNIKPYFELIGLEFLEQPLGTTKYKFLSQFLDELEQEIDNTESKILDHWWYNNIDPLTYSNFYKGYTELLTLNIPDKIKQKVQFLINNLPKP